MEILEGYLWSFSGPYKADAILTPHKYLDDTWNNCYILTDSKDEPSVKYFDDGPINPRLCTEKVGFLGKSFHGISYEVKSNSGGFVSIFIHPKKTINNSDIKVKKTEIPKSKPSKSDTNLGCSISIMVI